MIRLADAGDVAALAELERVVFGAGAWSARSLAEEVGAPTRTVHVVPAEAGVAGYACTAVVADVADLLRIAVSPAHRRAGLAATLLEAAVEAAAERGAVRMLLEVAEDNLAARALYAAAGFGDVSRRRGYYPGGVDALVLGRRLP